MGRLYRKEGPYFSSGAIEYPKAPPTEYYYEEKIFDKRSRPIFIQSPDTTHGLIEWQYEYSGFSWTIIDPDGSPKTEKKDYLGRIIEVFEHADAGDHLTLYQYDAAGDLTQVLDHAGNATIIEYDTLGRKTNMTDPDMGSWQYTYDANGNLITQTDNKSQTITFAYDTLNRLTGKTYSTGQTAVVYKYDNTASQKNGIGRLHWIDNTSVKETVNEYDALGRAKIVTKEITGNSYTTEYGYDLAGKPAYIVYPQDSYHLNYYYYPDSGLLQSVVGITDLTTYAEISDYQPNGKIGKIDYGNNTATVYTYDPQSIRLSGILAQKLDGGGQPMSDLLDRSYTYTAAGDIDQITDGLRNITYTYTYDALHRMTSESNTGTYDSLSYTYDAIGNMLTRTVGSDTFTYTYDTEHKHAVKTINAFGGNYNYSYDDNGNMTAGPDFTDPFQIGWRTISYNADNMPTHIERAKGGNTVTTDIVYDGNSARAKKTVQGGNTTYYISDNYDVIGTSPVKYVFAGNLRIAMIAGSGVNYFHKDHLGSSNVITDNAGATVETTEYMPFGSIREHTGAEISNYKFTDQELDPESGFYNYDARLYDPVIGRFLSAVTIVPYPFDPQILNRYSYVRNNPLIYIDPSGHCLGDLSGFGFDGIDGDGENKGTSQSDSDWGSINNEISTSQSDSDWSSINDEISESNYRDQPPNHISTNKQDQSPSHISPTGGPITSGFGPRRDPFTVSFRQACLTSAVAI